MDKKSIEQLFHKAIYSTLLKNMKNAVEDVLDPNYTLESSSKKQHDSVVNKSNNLKRKKKDQKDIDKGCDYKKAEEDFSRLFDILANINHNLRKK